MLLVPSAASVQTVPAREVGVTCRICPNKDCAGRREPSILQPA
jgi:predicted transcriptional regulator